MMKYLKKRIVVHAYQMTEELRDKPEDWPDWLSLAYSKDLTQLGALYKVEPENANTTLAIATLEGPMHIRWGDYIICDGMGVIYPCKEYIFNETYEPLE